MKKPRQPTSLEFALLGLLHQAPQSGYDLRQVFATTALGNYSSSPGAIYPALKRLEASGLVRGTVDSTKELRPRKVFTPTAAGRRTFADWLRQKVTLEDVARRFDQLMLKFAFYPVLADASASRAFLVDLAEHLDTYVDELVGQRSVFPKEAPLEPRLALDAGIEQTRAAARWARSAARRIEKETP